MGYIFIPFAWMLGIEESQCQQAGELLAIKILVNEYVAYAKLAEKVKVSFWFLSNLLAVVKLIIVCSYSFTLGIYQWCGLPMMWLNWLSFVLTVLHEWFTNDVVSDYRLLIEGNEGKVFFLCENECWELKYIGLCHRAELNYGNNKGTSFIIVNCHYCKLPLL